MIFNTIFNHIYVLNLKESTDRRKHIEDEFKRVGIEKYDFFEATPYYSDEVKNLTKSNLVKKFPNCFRCDKKRCDCENNFLTPFQIANWCSFINIFNDIIKNDYKFVLICEDDIVFTFQYERIINTLLSKQSFKNYQININKPLLIRLGTAYNSSNHDNTNTAPIFIKNYPLCNPCFAINKEMAIIYLKYLKIIDYHSDVYFHKKIPKSIPGIQFLTMFPYPIYELSFVKSKRKFNSLIRPPNSFRRKEFKEILLLSSNVLINIFLKSIVKKTLLDIKYDNIGYNGNIDSFILMDENEKEKYYFENKILLIDHYYDDIKIIYYNITKNNIHTIQNYDLYLNKINLYYHLNLNLENNENILENIILFYHYYLKLLNINIQKIININNHNDFSNIVKYLKIPILNKDIVNYNIYKKLLLDSVSITNLDIDNIKNNIESIKS